MTLAVAETPRRRYAREFRRVQTDAERVIWRELRSRRFAGLKFRRQHPIGPFVVDFSCPEARLIIELDGGQHASQSDDDARRTALLQAHGYRVLRFWNNEVLGNLAGVLQRLLDVLSDPHPGPLPGREREKEKRGGALPDAERGKT
jgi:very-short-patch-repair endonuclease